MCYNIFSSRRRPENHHFWVRRCNILFSFIFVGSDRALPWCPSGQQWTLRCCLPPRCQLRHYAEIFLILTVCTRPINNMQGGASQRCLILESQCTRTITLHMHTCHLTSEEKRFNLKLREYVRQHPSPDAGEKAVFYHIRVYWTRLSKKVTQTGMNLY